MFGNKKIIETLLDKMRAPKWEYKEIPLTGAKICVIIKGGAVQEVLGNCQVEVEVVDFDSLALSTAKEESLFHQKLSEFPLNLEYESNKI